jgi:two-component system, sensor histidine kinase
MTPASRLAPGVQRELFLLGYKNILASGIGGMAAATLLGAALWSMRQTPSVLIWMAFAYMTNSFAWYLLLAFRADAREIATAQLDQKTLARIARWRLLHTLFVVASCCVWAGLCALLDVADPRANVLILVCMLAVLAFAASSHGVHNIVSFVLSAVVGVPIMLYYLPGAFTLSVTPISVLFCMFGVVCIITAINANRTMIAAIELRLSNGELATRYALAAERADQASREKSNFLAAAAHDMRQPVHSLMLLQGVLRQTETFSQNSAVLDQMQVATNTIGKIFDSVMELSRLESGTTRAHFEPVPLEAFVSQRIAQHLPMAAEKGLRIRMHKSLSSVGAWVAADKLLLMRLIDNLIGNAIKYTSQGGVLITLRKNTPRKLYLEVWDTGIGVAEVDVQRIFEPYVQIGNPTRNREKGLGLGLAIVKSCADLMAIPIAVTSKLGKGSRFRITLTKTSAPTSFTTLPLEKPPSNGDIVFENTFKGLKVLVFEDDPLVTSAIEALFLSWAIDFKHAGSFDELRLSDWVPELVLCDFRLPGRFDGLATLELIRRQFPSVACILQTGELSPEIALKAKSKGYGLLVKPVEVDVLATAIKNSLVH